jgi:hypothetical protein
VCDVIDLQRKIEIAVKKIARVLVLWYTEVNHNKFHARISGLSKVYNKAR